ncbi:MAG: hypothetical protein DA328_09445 [Nitrososphaeraceae archaeon]|nr:hypothetical protein [Nitrososphaeraceae archaeon]
MQDTKCENENELNNQLTITNITQSQEVQPETTLNVIKTFTCQLNGNTQNCENLDVGLEFFVFTVTGNNPSFS